jgi:PadR family transcriptional regulator PadR
MRKTHALVQVALALMETPRERHWGYDLSRRAGVRSGALYPILHRMLDEGWLTDGWEEIPVDRKKRPPRRYYELTDLGLTELGGLVASAQTDRRFAGLAAGFAW